MALAPETPQLTGVNSPGSWGGLRSRVRRFESCWGRTAGGALYVQAIRPTGAVEHELAQRREPGSDPGLTGVPVPCDKEFA
jgi:hypothetical protein